MDENELYLLVENRVKMDFKARLLEKLIEGSIGVVLLSIVSFFLWQKIESNDKYFRDELKQLKNGYYDCLESRFDVANDQVLLLQNTLERNTNALNDVNQKL